MIGRPDWIAADHPISRLTTVGTGGPARWYAAAGTRPRLEAALGWAAQEGLAVAVIGLGSNLLAADSGYDGLVVKLVADLAAVTRDGETVECGGGAPLAVIVRRSRDWELSGIEFGCAIPGTAGGAVRMNAGAYGGELRDVLESAVVVSAGGVREGGPAELGMTYRRSNVAAGEVVSAVRLRLRPAPGAEIAATIRDMQKRRRDAQPAKVRTFGSVWKNPDPDRTAGRLLEECGMKGFQVGGARISPVHANFIENAGGATSAEVIALMAEARRRVREGYGLELEHEVQFLGDIDLPAA
jgi:UDP-N-acetylenolpyruvoylglucosamine reductase